MLIVRLRAECPYPYCQPVYTRSNYRWHKYRKWSCDFSRAVSPTDLRRESKYAVVIAGLVFWQHSSRNIIRKSLGYLYPNEEIIVIWKYEKETSLNSLINSIYFALIASVIYDLSRNTHLEHALHITFKCAMRMRNIERNIVGISGVTAKFYKLWVRCNAPDVHSAPRDEDIIICSCTPDIVVVIFREEQVMRRIVKKARYQKKEDKKITHTTTIGKGWEIYYTMRADTRTENISIRKKYIRLSQYLIYLKWCVLHFNKVFQNRLTSLSRRTTCTIQREIITYIRKWHNSFFRQMRQIFAMSNVPKKNRKEKAKKKRWSRRAADRGWSVMKTEKKCLCRKKQKRRRKTEKGQKRSKLLPCRLI